MTISGNVSDETKRTLASVIHTFIHGYSDTIGRHIEIIDANILQKEEEPKKLEAKVVCELEVREDMVNNLRGIHGSCSSYLVDICSSLPIIAMTAETEGAPRSGVSQVMNMVYHSPAMVGDRLRIVSTTMTIGSRAMSAKCEIWNKTHHRLVATGVHVKMDPSPTKL